MKTVNKKPAPVFVIGSARSGTSILSRLLRDYLHVSFGTESQFIIRFYKRLHNYGDLNQEDNIKTLLQDIGEERCFNRWKKFGYQIDLDRIYNRVKEKSYAGILDAIFTDLAEHNRMRLWGDKTPEYINDLTILLSLFPEAKFIHIVRDGRDVALSTFKTHFGAKNVGMAALEWNRQMECVSRFKKIVGSGQLIEIRYEEFIEQPVKIFIALMSFLEIDDREEQIQRIEKHLPEELNRGNSFKWKTQLKMSEQITFEKVSYKHLQDYGYPTLTNGLEKISSLEKKLWIIDHRLKQLTRIDTWKDNLYKFKLHTRQLIRLLKYKAKFNE